MVAIETIESLKALLIPLMWLGWLGPLGMQEPQEPLLCAGARWARLRWALRWVLRRCRGAPLLF